MLPISSSSCRRNNQRRTSTPAALSVPLSAALFERPLESNGQYTFQKTRSLPIILPTMLPDACFEHCSDSEDNSVSMDDEVGESNASMADSASADSSDVTAFPSELGLPYQRHLAPRTPQSQRRHEEVGERLVRLAARFFNLRARHVGSLDQDTDASRFPACPSSPPRCASLPNLKLKVISAEEQGARLTSSVVGARDWPAHSLISTSGATQASASGASSDSKMIHMSKSSPQMEGMVNSDPACMRRSENDTDISAGSSHNPPTTVIIFDWDDTLFPTWFVTEVVKPCHSEIEGGGPLSHESPFAAAMMEHAQTVRALLIASRAVGHVTIVTLSQRPWVETSSARFLFGRDFMQFLEVNQISVVYARECCKRTMLCRAEQDEGVNIFTVAKRAAMLKVLKRYYSRAPWENVISVGDSTVERDALKELLWSHVQGNISRPTRCKTVKLMEEPSVEQLSAELLLLNMWLHSMATHTEDFDITMDDSEETMMQFHEQFTSA